MTKVTTKGQTNRVEWVPVYATWIPVWASVSRRSGALDPLELAVLQLVELGAQDASQVAAELCMSEELVDSAVASLAGRGHIKPEDQGLGRVVVRLKDGDTEPRFVQRPGWVVWDPLRNRLLTDLVLTERPPRPGGEVDSEPNLFPSESRRDQKRPSWGHIDREVSHLLAMEVRLIEESAGGTEVASRTEIRELRRRTDRPLRTEYSWTAVEFCGAVPTVWRSSALPLDPYGTDLSVAGWPGLLDSLEEGQRLELEKRQRFHLTEVAPGLVRQLGYDSVHELDRWCESRYDDAMGDAARALWPDVREEVLRAMQAEELGRVIDSPSSSVARSWAHVLEVLTRRLAEPAVLIVRNGLTAPPQERDVATREAEWLLGPTLWAGVRHLRKRQSRRELASRVQRDCLTIGGRLIAMGWTAWTNDRHRRRFGELRVRGHTSPAFFEHLSKAVAQRNDVIHPKPDQPPVNAVAFRQTILDLCQAAAVMSRP